MNLDVVFVALLTVVAVGMFVLNTVLSLRNSRLREENRRLAGRFEGQMRTLAALASDTDDRIESITIERCDQCPHCTEAVA